MKWQKSREHTIKYSIVVCMFILSFGSLSAQEFILGQEKLLKGYFSPNGNLLAAKTAAGVLVFDTDNLRPIKTLSTQGLGIDKLAFSPDSRYLAWSENRPGGGVGVWDLSTSKQVAYFKLNAFRIPVLLFVPGGELLATQADDYVSVGTPDPGVVHFWQVGTWKKHGAWSASGNLLRPSGSIGSLAFTHDGKRFVASTTRGGVGAWVDEQFFVDVETLKPVSSHQIQERIIAYSPDGRFEIVPVGWDNRVLLIRDPQNHNQIANLSDPVTGYLLFDSISPDGNWLATKDFQRQVLIWDTQTWEIQHRLELPGGQTIAQGFVKDNYWYANLAPTGELQLWDLIKGELLASSNEKYDRTNGEIVAIDVSPDSKWIAAATFVDRQVIVWNLETHDIVKTIRTSDIAFDVQFSSDGSRLAVITSGRKENIRVWDTTTWKPIALYVTEKWYTRPPVAFIPKEHKLVIADVQRDHGNRSFKIVLWDSEADSVIRETEQIEGRIGQIRLSHDGKFIATTRNFTVQEFVQEIGRNARVQKSEVTIWEATTLKQVALLHDHGDPIAFHPNNQWIACTEGKVEVVLWNFQTDEVKLKLDLPGIQIFKGTTFSPDGSYLAAFGGEDSRVVRLFYTNLLEEEATFETHQRDVSDVLFTPDGRYLITASQDGKVRGWLWRDALGLPSNRLKRFTWGDIKSAELLANYPNPANPETWIPFVLHETADVEICIYDVAGNLVRLLRLGTKAPGSYRNKEQAAYWDGKNNAGEAVTSGIYFYEMHAGNYTSLRKAVIRK